MGAVDTVALIAALAGSGLSDEAYAAAVAHIRMLDAHTAAGYDLARVVLDHEHYQPTAVMTAVGGFYAASTLANAA